MAAQDTARTIILDLVRLEKLGADLERRWRSDPATTVADVLADIDPEDHILYLPQLNKLLEDLVKLGRSDAPDTSDAVLDHTLDQGDMMQRSLLATAVVEGSGTKGSSGGSGKISGKGSSEKKKESSAPERIDQFRIIRELGTGAFGVVYLAEDESLQRRVAIKVPKVTDPTRCQSYINEARKAAAIDSKGIVPIYHVGTKDNGIPFVVQKLIDGPSLRLLLSRYGSLPPAHAVTLLRDVAISLGAAHRLGIYHRDLKPDNILIDAVGVPWIADFGLAISESEQAQRKGEIAGTLMYMSPEQIQGRADWLDGRSDIWALGIMLYELLLGKPPFDGKNRQSLMEQICHREPRPLQQSSAVLAPLNDVFTKCCAKSPSDRYATAETLAAELSIILEEGWLPAQPIDGTELTLEQPISQFGSRDSQGSRSRSSGSNAASHLSGVGSTRAGGNSATQFASGQSAVGNSQLGVSGSSQQAFASGSLSSSGSLLTSVSPKTEQRTRVLMIGIGLVCVAAIGIQQYISRNSEPGVIAVPTTGSSGTANDEAKEGDQADVTVPPIANAMSIDKANGTLELPFVVAADGSGSHRTVTDAIAACKAGDHVSLKPGTYEEAIKLSKPVHLVGSGEPAECVIYNTKASPIEIAIPLGEVKIVGMTIKGDGRQTQSEFNAIELTSGKLVLEKCELHTTTYNDVKVQAGTSLFASGCKFKLSNQFAISAKSPIDLMVTDCDFFLSGVQIVEGKASLSESRFLGSEGVYVEQSGGQATTISGCDFKDCADYGILATTTGNATVKKCTFGGCVKGIWVASSDVVIEQSTFTNCKTGIDMTGGTTTVTGATKLTGGTFGAGVSGGTLKLVDAEFADQATTAIIMIKDPKTQVSLENVTISNSGTSAIEAMVGTLKLDGGMIRDCKNSGVYFDEQFARADIIGTQFVDNLSGAIFQNAGDLNCEDAKISGSDIGIMVQAAENESKVGLTRVVFENISGVAVQAAGLVAIESKQCVFLDIPEDRQFDASAGAKVNLYK